MATALRRPVSHDDRLSLVEHLDELRSRLIVCVLALMVCFGFAFWQNEAILKIVNQPLESTQNLDGKERSNDPLEQNARFQVETGKAFRAESRAHAASADAYARQAEASRSPRVRDAYLAAARAERAAARASAVAAESVPTSRERKPVTLGVAEPFTTTMSVAFYASLLLAMPFLLFQAYAFILPAFQPKERKLAIPLMAMVPVLFVAGVVFGYYVVLNRAVDFLQNFNDDDFDILVQARDYYRFAIMFLAGIGFLFQIPVGVLVVTRLGLVTPKQLQKNAGYVLLGIAVLAAVLTPTPDPFTMLFAMVPLFLLFELSILVAAWVNKLSPPGRLWGDDEDALDEGEDDHDGELEREFAALPGPNHDSDTDRD